MTTRTRPLLAVLLLLALLAAAVGATSSPASADPIPPGYTYTDGWFESHDGLQLHAGIYLPEDRGAGERHPVLLSSTPYTAPNGGALGGNLEGQSVRFPEVLAHPAFQEGRYAFVAVDVRGFGGSEGCFQYYMPNEARDVATAVEWAAAQEWSDGNVGMWGKSYDGAQMVLGLAARPPSLDAVIIQAPGLSAYTALWMNGVHYATGRYATTSVYTLDDLFPAQNLDTVADPNYARAAAAPATTAANYPTCRTDQLAMMNAVADRSDPFWADKEPYRDAAGADIPTFWVHGFFDANTKPVHTDIWSSLTGPRRAWFGQFSHLRGHEGGVGRGEVFLDEAFAFLDEHVRGVTPADQGPRVTVQRGDGDRTWRYEDEWPPADASPWAMALNTGTYVDGRGNGAGSPYADGLWSVTPVLPHPAHLAGEPRIHLDTAAATGQEQVVVHLYDIDESGRASLVTRGAAKLSLVDPAEGVLLYPQDWVFEEGHRIGVHLSGSDDAWFTPGVTGGDVEVVGSPTLDLPLLSRQRTQVIEGQPGEGSGVRPFQLDAATIGQAETGSVPPPQEG